MPPSIDIPASLLEQILADPVQLLWTGQRVEREFLHVGLDEAILRGRGEDVIDQPLVARPERGAAAAAAWRIPDHWFKWLKELIRIFSENPRHI